MGYQPCAIPGTVLRKELWSEWNGWVCACGRSRRERWASWFLRYSRQEMSLLFFIFIFASLLFNVEAQCCSVCVCVQCCLSLASALSVTTTSTLAGKAPGASQSHFPLLTVQICKRELSVLLHKTLVNPHFPCVSKITQLIRLPSLISCLWDHKNQNFIGGWFPQALPCLLWRPVSLYLLLSLLSSRSPFSSPSTVVITVPINTEHQWKSQQLPADLIKVIPWIALRKIKQIRDLP